jgi:hypothetical protein
MGLGIIIYGVKKGDTHQYTSFIVPDSATYDHYEGLLKKLGFKIICGKKDIKNEEVRELNEKANQLVGKLREQGPEGLEEEIETVFQ